jgi:predicted DNA-binding transcriptional regulator AlpA
MNVELIEKKELQSLAAELSELRKAITGNSTETEKLKIISTKEFQSKFGISKVTQWKLRKTGRLPYFTIGRQVFYRVAELDKFFRS